MKRNIEKELSILGITNNIDKLKYITNQIDPYGRTLYSKKYKFREYLIEWINQQTPLLNDEIYNITTKIYWIFNNITSWNDVRVRCQYCHKPYYNINVISIRKGYRKFCSHRCSTLSSETQLKRKNTNFIKYGDEKYINVDKIKQRYYSKTKEQKQEIKDKRKNSSFNISNPEKECYKLLCFVFGEENVKKQYNKDQRYPFLCDFYIKSKDLFIEYNGHWTHGKHPFDMNNMNDNDKLKKWEEKSQNSKFYKKAIEVWTILDVKKRNTAKQNNLNYLEFFNMKQFNDWISTVNR